MTRFNGIWVQGRKYGDVGALGFALPAQAESSGTSEPQGHAHHLSLPDSRCRSARSGISDLGDKRDMLRPLRPCSCCLDTWPLSARTVSRDTTCSSSILAPHLEQKQLRTTGSRTAGTRPELFQGAGARSLLQVPSCSFGVRHISSPVRIMEPGKAKGCTSRGYRVDLARAPLCPCPCRSTHLFGC